ncbi:anti-sigma factor family protein [Chitinophaga japonensis]|uniref:Uncharacterized protein n=1 Tax=Chitinophaga japonensis TaxID=104662 RepID=A0A562TF49_CHIJA|nr:hypothetical protein [Chitinophaga japonensis]TWI91894.1 hypothetical protein LX66_1275 [Chitinophaga japonensis]
MSVDINISNYEEYLLCYIDGELNNEERAALEAFLQQHPRLGKELEVLKAAILKPDEQEGFGNREILYRSTEITTENYEAFLLSYMDGELNAAERTALEAFLKKHPHLEQELETWQATRLQADPGLQFDNREMLYRHTGTLTTENYETYLLSYIDGELSEKEEQALQQFLQQHPELQPALQVLQRTRLQPDPALRMPGKADLYRKTGNRGVIRPAWWWGAAAAVVAGCLVWLLPLQQNTDTVQTAPVAVTTPGAPENNGAGNTVPAPSRALPAPDPDAPQVAAHMPATRAEEEAAAPAARQPAPVTNTPARQPSAITVAAAPAPAKPRPAGNNNNTAVLAQLPQPPATSAEVVEQHLEKHLENAMPPARQTPIRADQSPVLANNMDLPPAPAPAAEKAAPAPESVQGELIMSVTSSSESKLLNGVTSIAKFFSKKKNRRSE